MVALLVDNGADVNAVDDIQIAPLHLASNTETAELLIDAGANVNARVLLNTKIRSVQSLW